MRPWHLGWRAWAGAAIALISIVIVVWMIVTDAEVHGWTIWG